MKRIRSAIIKGKRWRIDWTSPGQGEYGLCHYDEKRIQISPHLDDVTTVSVLVDEITHAHFIQLDNDFVDQFSDDVAKVLRDCKLIAEDD